jgi:hypothetical protein
MAATPFSSDLKPESLFNMTPTRFETSQPQAGFAKGVQSVCQFRLTGE